MSAGKKKAPLTEGQGSALITLKHMPGYSYSGDKKDLALLVRRGLLEVTGQVPHGKLYKVTPAGLAAIEAGVPHSKWSRPFAFWSLEDQLDFAYEALAKHKSGEADNWDDYKSWDEIINPMFAIYPKPTEPPRIGSWDSLRPPEPSDELIYNEAGSAKLGSAGAKALYRLLWLFKPPNVNFSDMYKSGLFRAVTHCGRFMVSVELFKYEPGLYFYALPEFVAGKGTAVAGGWPGADNGVRCSDKQGQRLFSLIAKLATMKHDIYPGNDFSV